MARTEMSHIFTAALRLSVLAVLTLAVCTGCEKESPKAKQIAKITLLPDTPPPPPPPPPKDPPPPPKDQQKEVKLDQPKLEAPPQPTSLKTDEAPGDGPPGGIVSGKPTGDYTGQELGGTGQPGGSGIDRAAFEVYRTRLQRILQDELARMKELKGAEYRLPARVRRAPDTQAWNVSFPDSTGDAQIDELLRSTLNRLIQKDPPPAGAPSNGFSVRVTNKFLN